MSLLAAKRRAMCCCGGAECFLLATPCDATEDNVQVPDVWPEVPTPDLAFNTTGTGAGTDCCADIDSSGTVDDSDYFTMLGDWGTSSAASDLNDDGIVDEHDLAALLLQIGYTTADCASKPTCLADGNFGVVVESEYLTGQCMTRYYVYATVPSNARVVIVLDAVFEDGDGVPIAYMPKLGETYDYEELSHQSSGSGGSYWYNVDTIGAHAQVSDGRVLVAILHAEHCADVAGTFGIAWAVGDDLYSAETTFTIDAPECKEITSAECQMVRVPCASVQDNVFEFGGQCYSMLGPVTPEYANLPLASPEEWHASCFNCLDHDCPVHLCGEYAHIAGLITFTCPDHACEEEMCPGQVLFWRVSSPQAGVVLPPFTYIQSFADDSHRGTLSPSYNCLPSGCAAAPIGSFVNILTAFACCEADSQWRIGLSWGGSGFPNWLVFRKSWRSDGCPQNGAYEWVGAATSDLCTHFDPTYTCTGAGPTPFVPAGTLTLAQFGGVHP